MGGEISVINELKRQDGDDLPVVDKSRVRGLLDALAAFLPSSLFGQPSGVAGLDANGKLRRSQVPDFLLGNLYWAGDYNFTTGQVTWSDPAQNGQPLPAASDTNRGQYFITIGAGVLNGYDYNTGDWMVSYGAAKGYRRVDNTDAVQSVAGRTGAVVLNKNDVGLASVNNTADVDKPLSSAAYAALALKADLTLRWPLLSCYTEITLPTGGGGYMRRWGSYVLKAEYIIVALNDFFDYTVNGPAMIFVRAAVKSTVTLTEGTIYNDDTKTNSNTLAFNKGDWMMLKGAITPDNNSKAYIVCMRGNVYPLAYQNFTPANLKTAVANTTSRTSGDTSSSESAWVNGEMVSSYFAALPTGSQFGMEFPGTSKDGVAYLFRCGYPSSDTDATRITWFRLAR
jgi:hypothetical protein